MRVCRMCGVEKPLSDFYSHIKGKELWSYRCKECDKAKLRQRYQERKAAIALLVDAGRNKPCSICGIVEPVVIEFHHLEKKGKHWGAGLSSIETVKNELRKCVPVCANCHLRLHAGSVTIPTDVERVYE